MRTATAMKEAVAATVSKLQQLLLQQLLQRRLLLQQYYAFLTFFIFL